MKLTNEQILLLENWATEGNKFYLQWQLDRKAYVNINQVLETIWLKWNKKEKAHIAEWLSEQDLLDAIDDIIETWEVETVQETIKKFQFYPTPKEVVDYMIELADIKDGSNVLEPSAWQWSIIDWILSTWKDCYIVWVELNSNNFEILKSKYDIELHNTDFTEFNTWIRYDRIVANPPFSKSQDVKHILDMYNLLKDWWKIVSVASNWIIFREWKVYDKLRSLNPEIIKLDEWSFKDSWTLVNTVLVIITK